MLEALRRRWRPLRHRWHAVLLVLLVVAPLYYLTRTPPDQINVDTDPVAMTAWHVVHEGTVDLRGFDTRGNYFVQEQESGRVLSNRPVGLWIVALPPYLTSGSTYSPEPSTVWSVAIASAAVAVMVLLLWRVVEPPWALTGSAVFALGTATWPISSAEIWPHGPGQLLLGLALLALASERASLAGVASAMALLVRPVTAVLPGLAVLVKATRGRWRDAAAIALPVGAALVGLLLYNDWAFGSPSISGGYGSDFTDRLTGSPVTTFFRNLANSLLSPNNGLFVWSPIVAVVVLGLRGSWPLTPRWAREALIGAVVYFMLHARLNRASGGLPFDYRYALEPLTLAWPALVMGARDLFGRREVWRMVIVAAAAASVIAQGSMAVHYSCMEVPGADDVCSIL